MVAAAAIVLWRQSDRPPLPPAPISAPLVATSPADAVAPLAPKESPLLVRLRSAAEAANSVADDQRDAAWSTLVDSISLTGIPESLRALTPAEDEASAELRQLLVRRWASSAPSVAADWAARFAGPSIQKEALQQVGVVWAQTDLPQAIQWAKTLSDTQRLEMCLTLAYEAARTDPKTALTLAADLPSDQAGTDLILHSAAQWAVGEPAAAAEWAKQIVDETLRDQVISAIATQWGARDPVAAANLALKSISAGRSQDDAVIGIVQRWAQTDPQAAADWVADFPPGKLQEIALENLAMTRLAWNSPSAAQ